MRHQNLFVITSVGIKTFEKRRGSEELELVRVNGGEFYTSSIDGFWTWWERASSYLAAKDQVDFCIIKEESVAGCLQAPPFTEVAESKWEIAHFHFVFQRIGLGAVASLEKTTNGTYRIQDQYAQKWFVQYKERGSTAIEDESERVVNELLPQKTKQSSQKEDTREAERLQKVLVEGDMAFYYRNKTKAYQRSEE